MVELVKRKDRKEFKINKMRIFGTINLIILYNGKGGEDLNIEKEQRLYSMQSWKLIATFAWSNISRTYIVPALQLEY